MMAEWQPIETAPKDGQDILAVDARGRRRIMFWRSDRNASRPNPRWGWAGAGAKHDEINGQPVYWMPLPEAPTESATKAA